MTENCCLSEKNKAIYKSVMRPGHDKTKNLVLIILFLLSV